MTKRDDDHPDFDEVVTPDEEDAGRPAKEDRDEKQHEPFVPPDEIGVR